MSKKHWLDTFKGKYQVDHPQIEGGWINEVYIFRKDEFDSAILDTIKSKLPEEKVWDMSMDETGREVDAWNECLKAVKESLKER